MTSTFARAACAGLTALLCLSLFACGGGGGGDDGVAASPGTGTGGTGGGGGGGGGTVPVVPSTVVTFTPATLAANVAYGTSATLTVRATASNVAQFSGGTVYAVVVDPQHLLSPSIELAAVDSTTISATIHTVPTLAAGRYQGTFQVQLCKDAACGAQIAGSPVALPYDLTIGAAPLQAAATRSTAIALIQGSQFPTVIPVSVSGPGLSWRASTTAAWLSITGGSGTGSGSFTVGYVIDSLSPGTFNDVVTITSMDGQTTTVPFSLTLTANQLELSELTPAFTAINGAPIASRTLGLTTASGQAVSWSASTPTSWLTVTPTSGMTVASTPTYLTLQADPSHGNLASGHYAGSVTVNSTGLAAKTFEPQLTLVMPTLGAAAPTLTLGGTKGRDLTASQSTTISLNTETNSWPFTVSALPAWLTTSTASGSVNATGRTITFAPGTTPVGSQSATVTVTAAVNADRPTLPLTVNLNVDQRRLLPSEWGVAFAATPAGTTTSRSITIRSNFGDNLTWTAHSSASWLSATSGGSTGGSPTLALTANPASLPNDVVSYANVTVSTTTPGVSSAVIRVGLWKSANGPTQITTISTPLQYQYSVADPIRPLIYVNSADAFIDVYNAYTSQKVATIGNLGGALGRMTASPDGSLLYATDTTNQKLIVIDLASGTKVGAWSLVEPVYGYTFIQAARPNGVEVVLVQVEAIQRAYTAGRSLGLMNFNWAVQAAPDGRSYFGPVSKVGLDYSEMGGGMLFSQVDYTYFGSQDGTNNVVYSHDSSKVYLAALIQGNLDNCLVYDNVQNQLVGTIRNPNGIGYANNVALASGDRPICGYSGPYADFDFALFSTSRSLVQTYKIAGYAKGILAQQMVTTADGFVLFAITDDPLIAFVPIAP